MKGLKLWRTLKEGSSNFYRNGWLSFATVSVLAISLYIISITAILGFTAKTVLSSVQDKINISIYFKPEVKEEKIQEIQKVFQSFVEIKSADYVSKEQALEEFKLMAEIDSGIGQALEELGENPLLSSLVIKAKNPKQYEEIVMAISDSKYSEYISRINYQENKVAIERLGEIIRVVEQVGITLGVVYVFIGVLITFNAIRLTMYAQKQEFEVKRLVGASNLYIQMPFFFEGIFYGITSAVVVALALFVTARALSEFVTRYIPEADLLAFYGAHFGTIFSGLVLAGVFLGVVSSFIAIKRYLKI